MQTYSSFVSVDTEKVIKMVKHPFEEPGIPECSLLGFQEGIFNKAVKVLLLLKYM